MRVIGGACTAIAKEMAGVLFRVSYSSIIRESEDLGAGIFDADGNVLTESDSTPMFMGAMPKIVKNVIRLLGDDIHEGDIILHNDPYGGATHSPDVAIVVPIFLDGELTGFAGASAHLLDIGGAYPGLAIDLVDNWSEGNIYRAIKLSDRGVRQDQIWRHILENMRTPTYNRGDIEAMIAACELARRRYLELLERYGRDAVLSAAGGWLDYSERMLRQEIAKLPDGTYETEVGWLDDDGRTRGVPLPVKVAVKIEGDEITFDLTGSSPEVPTGFTTTRARASRASARSSARSTWRCAPSRRWRRRKSPPATPPTCTSSPTRDSSRSRASTGSTSRSTRVPTAAVTTRTGLDSIDCLIANTRNNPIEELGWRYPMRTERYELREDPCAAGKWRGGVGMVRTNRFPVDTIVTCEGERNESDPPWGIFGGQEGVNASTKITRSPNPTARSSSGRRSSPVTP